jgi:hypothetical protein
MYHSKVALISQRVPMDGDSSWKRSVVSFGPFRLGCSTTVTRKAGRGQYCIFCRRTDSRREHVWVDWLKAYIPKNTPYYSSLSAVVHPGGYSQSAEPSKYRQVPYRRSTRQPCSERRKGVPNVRDRAPRPHINTNIVSVQTVLETLNVNSRKTQ